MWTVIKARTDCPWKTDQAPYHEFPAMMKCVLAIPFGQGETDILSFTVKLNPPTSSVLPTSAAHPRQISLPSPQASPPPDPLKPHVRLPPLQSDHPYQIPAKPFRSRKRRRITSWLTSRVSLRYN